MMESSVSKCVLLSEKLQRRNCPSKKNFKKIVKNGQLRIVSGEILNSEVKMLPAGSVTKQSNAVTSNGVTRKRVTGKKLNRLKK